MHTSGVLREIVANLDAAGVRIECAGRALDLAPTDVVIHDPSDPAAMSPGAVLLAVGVRGSEAVVLQTAAAQRVGTVVLRREVEPELLRLAGSLDLTILSVPAELTWGQLYSLFRTASAGLADDAQAGPATGDLFAVADAIAAAVGGPVTIEDPQWRILAFSNLDQPIDEARRQTILGRTPPAEWHQRIADAGVLQALRAEDRVVRFEAPGVADRIVAPVRAGAELLGSIWVAQADEPLGAEAEAELQRAAHAAAVHLLVHRAAGDLERRARDTFVRDALHGRADATRRPGGARRPERRLCALCFVLDEAEDWSGDLERILSIVGLFAEGYDAGAMCAVVDDRIWALMPVADGASSGRLVQVAANVVERVERMLGVRLRAAAGAVTDGFEDLPRSRRTAERALTVAADRVVDHAGVRAACELGELTELAARHGLLADGCAGALAGHDPKLREALLTWLQLRDVRAAARALGVHPNTLRRRLDRALEVTRLDVADPDERLVAELQLRAGA